MYGAILGDIIGSPYEFDQGDKTKDFPLFSQANEFTDDSILTLAVAEAFYGVPHDLKQKAREYLTPDLLDILERFDARMAAKK